MKNYTLTRVLLTLGLCFTLFVAHAQVVAIPDSNFGNWLLHNGYSSCLSGNSVSGFRLDTSCSAVTSADSIECRYSNIYDLTGLQYFHNITYLDCSDNHLTSIPSLPPTLTTLNTNNNPLVSLPALPPALIYLFCDTDRLSSLPMLPAGLTFLTCDSNYLTALPALPNVMNTIFASWNQLTALPTLPDSLTYMTIQYNNLASLPALPAGMTFIDLWENSLTSLPALPPQLGFLGIGYNHVGVLPALPGTLYSLECSGNNFASLPALPNSLNYLDCSFNTIALDTFPTLPDSLQTFYCDYDTLYSLPPLPPFLYDFECYGNFLTSIPPLPPFLNELDCALNQLSSLPPLPAGLSSLNCAGNPSLSCLPRIYQNVLENFYINGTAITCMPNSFTALYYDTNPAMLPLCTPSSGCDFYYNVAGNVHSDTSANCSLDSLYPGHPITDLKVQLIENGQVVQQFYTFTSGNYTFQVDSFTNYTVSVDTTWLPLSVVCPGSDTQYVSLSALDSVATGVNFGMVCSNFDYGVGYIWGHHFRPTYTSHVHIGAGNIARVLHNIDCGAGMSGTVTTTLAGSITYVNPAPGALTPTSVSGNVLTYNLTDLDSLTWGSLDLIVLTDTGAVAGTDACFTTIITPSTPDMNPYDDTLTECFTIVHSWDPNSKSVTPSEITENSEWLNYTIEFQNTGTDTAYTVVVKDTLSSNVEASTFQYTASSNKVVVQLFGNAMVFTFPQIDLVDSATNDSLSIGWIQYRVKSKPNLPLGTQVNNTAYVYFDQNPAVVTNTVVSTVGTTGIHPIAANNPMQLYPNPNKGTFTLQTSGSINNDYTISDMLGNVIVRQTISTDRQSIDLSGIAEGVYTITVKGSQPLRFTVVR